MEKAREFDPFGHAGSAQFAGSGVSVSKVRNEDGSDATGSIFAPVSVVDLIETDYH